MGRSAAGLADWLRGLPEYELIALLSRRPDVMVSPEPRSFVELADRLSSPHSVRAALEGIDRSALQLAEVLQALGDGVSVKRLEETIGVPAERLERALDAMIGLGLVWPSSDRSRLRLVGPLRHLTENPLALGASVTTLLPTLTVEQLATIGASYGERKPRRKTAWIELLTEVLTDATSVGERLNALPPQVRKLAGEVAWRGPHVYGSVASALSAYSVRRDDDGTLLARLGWLLPSGWDGGQMPREIALAIRGPDYRPPLDPEPLPLITTVVHPGHVEAGSAVAAMSTVDGLRRLIDLVGRGPLATLQAGGVGTRELGKAAKALGAKPSEVRLWLEIAVAAGLVAVHRGEVLPTATADDWLLAEPAAALATALRAWRRLRVIPLHHRDDDGKAQPALRPSQATGYAVDLRSDILQATAALPPQTAVGDLDRLIDQFAWRRPVRYGNPETLGPPMAAAWAECELLGLVAERAITPIGRALLLDADDELHAVAADLLPAPANTATFLPDLTAVVSGAASVELAAVLDLAADSETRDAASTWRFTPASVRRALDAGRTADELLAALDQFSDRPLPQPLSYLVRDVARRHGRLRVADVACCVVADDPALATEIASHRQLAGLDLRLLGATVLASAKPVDATLAALRAAGYAPVRQDSGGQTVIERVEARRVPAPRQPGPAGAIQRRPDPATLVRRLQRNGQQAALPELTGVQRDLAPFASQLSDAEQRLLAYAIEQQHPVMIDYINGAGSMTTRVIEPDTLIVPLLIAWCQLRDAERHFLLDRITAVAPAG